MRRAVAKLGATSCVIVERPLITPAIRAKYLERCQMLVNDLKFAPAGRVSIFPDEKTWTVDHVRNRRNGRYEFLGKRTSARTLSKMKHPASIILLAFVASNGAVMPLIWFLSGYQLTARDYEAKLADKLVLWINNPFDMSSATVMLQQDGAPAHTSSRVQYFLQEQNCSFLSKNMSLYSSDANPLDYALWPHIEASWCTVFPLNLTVLRTSVDRKWTAMSRNYVYRSCKSLPTLS